MDWEQGLGRSGFLPRFMLTLGLLGKKTHFLKSGDR